MAIRFKKYTHDAAYSYTFGVFPTLELLRYQPRFVEQIVLHSAGERNEGVDKIRALCGGARIPLTQDDKLVERLSPKDNTYALGVFKKYRPALEIRTNHVVLVNPSDMGNLGTTLRTLVGFGITNLALIKPAVDIFDPRAIRSSMGAVFQVNFAYYESFNEYHAAFQNNVYSFMTDGAVSVHTAEFRQPFALVFGNESSGLTPGYHAVGTSVSIPHRPAIDSLNLSIAIGIGVYEAMKRGSNFSS
jgi:RNA methyltransferase, TrmH family